MKSYRSTLVVEAVQWDGRAMSGLDIVGWLASHPGVEAAIGLTAPDKPFITVTSSTVGPEKVLPGEWIACTAGGTVEILTADEFRDLYEAV